MNDGGIKVGKDRVQRIRRREGLKVPKKQPKRARLWLADGSCIRLRPEYPNHVLSFDFVETQTHDDRRIRLMTLIDEFIRKCLAIRVARRINPIGVIVALADAMLMNGTPVHIIPDNGPAMLARSCVNGCQSLALETFTVNLVHLGENGYRKSFTGKLRDECPNGEIFYSFSEA